jgi:DnaJ-class molecular chaperone
LNPPYGIQLQSIGLGIGGEWTYSLSLTLEELFFGRRCRFNITRSYLSQKTKNVVIEIEVPPGCRPGTRIVCRHVGHECRPGVFQDIAFVVEEAKHNRFVRLFDDLIVEVRLPGVRKAGDDLSFVGIDGASLAVRVDYPKDKQMKGRNIIRGAGMPIRERGRVVGRGNLVVQ